jgi:hypothetical protein
MKSKNNQKYVPEKVILTYILVPLICIFFIGPLLLCLSNYLHESGHILYGVYGTWAQNGTFGVIKITNWMSCPFLPCLMIPQQTGMVEGVNTYAFVFGGTVVTLSVIFISSIWFYLVSKNRNKTFVFLFPALFLIQELVGNFLCGTDNFFGQPHVICENNPLVPWVLGFIPFLLGVPVFAIIWPATREIRFRELIRTRKWLK